MSAWKTFYAGREGHEYLGYVKERYSPFIAAINSRIRTRDLVLELGAGTGAITKALRAHAVDKKGVKVKTYCVPALTRGA